MATSKYRKLTRKAFAAFLKKNKDVVLNGGCGSKACPLEIFLGKGSHSLNFNRIPKWAVEFTEYVDSEPSLHKGHLDWYRLTGAKALEVLRKVS